MTRSIKLEDIPVKGDPEINHIEVELRFEAGGYSHWHNQQTHKGYYVSVCGVKIMVRDNGVVSRARMLGEGYKMLLEGANRFGQKKLEGLQQKARDEAKSIVDRLCIEKGLTIQRT
jgi:hypothetical protein